jgi:hypothetical protein
LQDPTIQSVVGKKSLVNKESDSFVVPELISEEAANEKKKRRLYEPKHKKEPDQVSEQKSYFNVHNKSKKVIPVSVYDNQHLKSKPAVSTCKTPSVVKQKPDFKSYQVSFAGIRLIKVPKKDKHQAKMLDSTNSANQSVSSFGKPAK